MTNPIDQGSILRSGQLAVPDYAAQEIQRRQMAAQEQQMGLQAQRQQQLLMEAQREQDRTEAFQAAMDDYLVEPDSPMAARKMAGLLGKFPEFRESIEGAWKGLDSAKQSSDIRALGNIYAAGEAGRYDVAASELQARIDAEVAYGLPADPIDTAMVQALKSGDPIQQRAAIRQAGLLLEVASGGKLTTTAKPTALEQNYRFRVETFGQEYADRMQQVEDDKFVPVQGKGIYRGSDFVESGVISGGIAERFGDSSSVRMGGYGGGTFDGRGRRVDTEGGDPASGGQEPIPFETFQEMQRDMGKEAAAAYIRNNRIPVMGPGASAGPVRVRSKQQFDRLPKGTKFIAPDGTTRIK